MNIVTEAQSADYLRGVFYHGTAIEKGEGFEHTAYFTQDRETATEYAWMDSEADGDPPMLIAVRLHCTKIASIDTMLMQDLAQHEHGRTKAKELIAAGYDCAVSDEPGHDEVCVLDPSKIEIVEVIKLPYRDGEWPEAVTEGEVVQFKPKRRLRRHLIDVIKIGGGRRLPWVVFVNGQHLNAFKTQEEAEKAADAKEAEFDDLYDKAKITLQIMPHGREFCLLKRGVSIGVFKSAQEAEHAAEQQEPGSVKRMIRAWYQ